MSGQVDLDRLEELARAATPGPWEHSPNDPRRNYTVLGPNGAILVASARCMDSEAVENAAYVAAVSPDVVLALVADARAGRRARERADEYQRQRLGIGDAT